MKKLKEPFHILPIQKKKREPIDFSFIPPRLTAHRMMSDSIFNKERMSRPRAPHEFNKHLRHSLGFTMQNETLFVIKPRLSELVINFLKKYDNSSSKCFVRLIKDF